ncbi:hydrolase [Aestuariibacter halophilus]|uniref:Hydrolase n=1 Tax=Fluctibacter halophilus TaxID=226011 RepID=A0ABS8G8Y6_9ALTE|nr:hydrolase [Aestuariibacter halophilus]MCC2617037.1 hydrolase [Aestuariibacter halophilus]
MKDCRTDSAPFGGIVRNAYRPPWWAKNRHVQTIWPKFFRRKQALALHWEVLDLPDGDELELAWAPKPEQPEGLVVLFHGLEGDVHSHYANDTMATLAARNYWVVTMHFRGCGRSVNRLPRAYHSGETGDALHVLSLLAARHAGLDLFAVGFSLGGNMLLKLQGELGETSLLRAAVAVSAPMCLSACAEAINRGFARRYQNYLLDSMKQGVLTKMAKGIYPASANLSEEKVRQLRSFRDFDHHITAPLHGFDGVDDYYRRASAMPFLKSIARPTLILHSEDDPFMDGRVIPGQQQLSDKVRLELSASGGHVGFVQGPPWRPQSWLPGRIADFIEQQRQEAGSAYSG